MCGLKSCPNGKRDLGARALGYPATQRSSLELMMVRVGVVTLLALLLVLRTVQAEVTPAHLRSLEFTYQLRQRQLYRLAELHCRQQLQQPSLSRSEKESWILELVDTLVDQMSDSDNSGVDDSWTAIDRIASEYQQAFGRSVEGFRVALRRLRVAWTRANWLLTPTGLEPNAERRERAGEILRRVTQDLRDLDDQVKLFLRDPAGERNPADAVALQRLTQEIGYTAGQVFLTHAELYDMRSADQIHLLTEAASQFRELARITPPTELAWESRLQEIETERRLGNEQDARAHLNQFPIDEVSPSMRMKFEIERARLDIEQGRPDLAAKRLRDGQPTQTSSLDVDLQADWLVTQVEAYVELSRLSNAKGNQEESRRWQILALDVIKQMEHKVPGYWVRRAERLMAIDPRRTANASDLEVIGRTADNLFRQGRIADARAAFQRGAILAEQTHQPEQVMTFGLKAASMHYQADEFASAVADFRQLAMGNASSPRAAQAHWLAITSAIEQSRKEPEFLATYETLLNEHLDQWPTSRWAPNARFWLGKLKAQQGDKMAAIDAWQVTRIDSPFIEQTLPALRNAYHRQLAQLSSQPDQQRSLAAVASNRFVQWRAAAERMSREESTEIAWDAALSAAEFNLLYEVSSIDYSLQLLSSLTSAPKNEEVLRNRKAALYGLANALSGDGVQAEQAWRKVDWDKYEFTDAVVQRLLASVDDNQRETTHDQVAVDATLRLMQQLQNMPHRREQTDVVKCAAIAQARGGDRDGAIRDFERLADKLPRDPDVQRRLASLYAQGETPDDHERAVNCWRKVVRTSAVDSQSWYEAKLGIARGLVQSGQPRRAVEIIDLLFALHPSMGGPELRREFTELRLQANSP